MLRNALFAYQLLADKPEAELPLSAEAVFVFEKCVKYTHYYTHELIYTFQYDKNWFCCTTYSKVTYFSGLVEWRWLSLIDFVNYSVRWFKCFRMEGCAY